MDIVIKSGNFSGEISVTQPTDLYLENLQKDRAYVNNVFLNAALEIIEKLEANEKINPKPKDEPCCDKFAMIKSLDEKGGFDGFEKCPYCGVEITPERRKKYIC